VTNDSVRASPADSSVRLAFAQSDTLGGDAMQRSGTLGFVSHNMTTRVDSGKGNGRSTMLSTTVNMLMVAPMPSAIVITTAAVNAGAFSSVRAANRESRRIAGATEFRLSAGVRNGHHDRDAESRSFA
jgi:hypothetical protein